MNSPIIRGGQGRNAKDVRECASALCWLVPLGLLAVAMYLIF